MKMLVQYTLRYAGQGVKGFPIYFFFFVNLLA